MLSASRHRLLRLARRTDADLGEAALLVAAEAEPDVDVDVQLLRLDALADGLRARGFRSADPLADAHGLADYLADEHGFAGDEATYHDPDNGLLTRVLDRRCGLPITLSILYVAVARRLEVPAYAINLPGHVVTGIAGGERPVVLDPFHRGRVLDEPAIAERVEQASGGRLEFRRAMLRPSPTVNVVRRLLNNLTRDFTTAGRVRDALWTVELKLLLPNRLPEDHRVHGDLLVRVGRFDAAAEALETYLEQVGTDAPDVEEMRRAAIRARARLN